MRGPCPTLCATSAWGTVVTSDYETPLTPNGAQSALMWTVQQQSDAPCRTLVITLETDKRLLSARNSREIAETGRLQTVHQSSGCLRSLRHRVLTGRRWTCGVHRRSSEIFVFLYCCESTGNPNGWRDFVDRERIDRVTPSVLRERRMQCECASSPGIASSKRLARRWTIKDKFLSVFGSCIIIIFFTPTRAVGVDAPP